MRLNLERGSILNTSNPTPDKSTRVTRSVSLAACIDEIYELNDLCNVSGVTILFINFIFFNASILLIESSSDSVNIFTNSASCDAHVFTFTSAIVGEFKTLSISDSVNTDTLDALVLNIYFGFDVEYFFNPDISEAFL